MMARQTFRLAQAERELDRLRAVNAELLEALEAMMGATTDTGVRVPAITDARTKARAAILKAQAPI